MATGSSTFRHLRIVGPSTGRDTCRYNDNQGNGSNSLHFFSAIPTAIAVVTDFGKREIARKYFIPKSLAKTAVKAC